MADETIVIPVTGETTITGLGRWSKMTNTGKATMTFNCEGGRLVLEPGETVTVTKDGELIRDDRPFEVTEIVDASRLRRANAKLSKEDAFALRAIVYGWLDNDEVTLLNPGGIAMQILSALDALAIVQGTERESAELDAALALTDKG